MAMPVCNPNCPENWVVSREQYVTLAVAFGLIPDPQADTPGGGA